MSSAPAGSALSGGVGSLTLVALSMAELKAEAVTRAGAGTASPRPSRRHPLPYPHGSAAGSAAPGRRGRVTHWHALAERLRRHGE